MQAANFDQFCAEPAGSAATAAEFRQRLMQTETLNGTVVVLWYNSIYTGKFISLMHNALNENLR